MYGERLTYKEAKALFDRTKGRALLRFVKQNVYVVFTGAMIDRWIGDWHHA